MSHQPPKYQAITLRNFRKNALIQRHLSAEQMHAIEVVGNVLPFKVNNYVLDELIDWSNIPEDPIFQLTFPQKEMLAPHDFYLVEKALAENQSKAELTHTVNQIRLGLNPHPAGQMEHNVPLFQNTRLQGIQHKYRETVLFFPKQSQTCHAYCTFCFRWPQFVGMEGLKFAMQETGLLVDYLKANPKVSDVLFTGGDPMIMKANRMEAYLQPLLEKRIPNLINIRIGSKMLGYWPYKLISDPDADDMLRLFERVVKHGYQLSFMAHFNHGRELQTPAAQEAIRRIRNTGAVIRTQSPIMRHINDHPHVWRDMWKQQVRLGCIPYYMFIARDTGAQSYFAVPLERCHRIYREAYQQVGGLARTVRGPSMSADPGKVQILGTVNVGGEKLFNLRFIQSRNPDWVGQPFFARYDPRAIWLDELKPAFDQPNFFFEEPVEISQMN
ncbi:MAG: hypothetical protein KDC57_10030 [Saprospiraceae bacterium]|nr:hypothetical protein [Saprospiraceae bacterium]